jgi:hypothetical protein
MLRHARRLRAYLVRRLHGWTYLIALACIAVGFFLVADGGAIFGCIALLLAVPATWLGGVWVSPWGDDAYVRAMLYVIRDGMIDAKHGDELRRDRLSKLKSTIIELTPPPEFTDLHRGIVSMMREIDRLAMDGTLDDLESRAIRIYELRTKLRGQIDDLRGYSVESYVFGLKGALEELLYATSDTFTVIEEPLRRRGQRLRGMRAPQHWRERHGRYVDTFGDYISALRDYYATLEGESVDATRQAAYKLRVRREALGRLTETFPRELSETYTGQR